jgi:tRNA threonylcarbamoyl adenosine modification protein (Sua5/YciO/YrdC/YwlC family)
VYLEINPYSVDNRKIEEVISILQKGGIIVVPTDTVYSFACDLYNKKALEKLARLKGVKLNKANFSLVCFDLSTLNEFTKPIDRSTYKVMNKALPGPYTFILNASNKVPKIFDSNKKEIGIRIPNNDITRNIVETLGNPLAVASVHDDDAIIDYTNDPSEIYQRFEKDVDLVIDGGMGSLEPSTIIDCTAGGFDIIREGLGSLDIL